MTPAGLGHKTATELHYPWLDERQHTGPTLRGLSDQIIPQIESLLEAIERLEADYATDVAATHPLHRESARNLLHYLALRQRDIRDLQNQLALLGLTRLGRAEAHVRGTLEAVLTALHALSGRPAPRFETESCTIATGRQLVQSHARSLFGPAERARGPRIMVTMPSDAATDTSLIEGLLEAGMDVMRINCAHDDADAWLAMIRNLRAAERASGRSCKVYADLAGPKLRTGALPPLGRMIQLKPLRDVWGRVVTPARVWLHGGEPAASDVPADVAALPVTPALLAQIEPGDRIEVDDSGGGTARLTLERSHGAGWLATATRHVHIREGADCRLKRGDTLVDRCVVRNLPEITLPLLLKAGDRLRLVKPDCTGAYPQFDADGRLLKPAAIPCTLAVAFDAVRADHAVWFDDGKIGGRVLHNHGDEIEVLITNANPKGAKLRPEKGINLPDTDLDIPALTAKDLADLETLAPHVDIIGLSFVRDPRDVEHLHRELGRLDAAHLGTVLKIETRQGFENLPRILLTSLRRPPVGIMVARGDLAVEIGFERLAEVQEEILWLREAAHVPVIWATQVLETMARRGVPTRAEVSDAALSVRAECVMLNKGPYIVDTTRFLDDILTAMTEHRAKSLPMMRRLSVSEL